MLQHCAASGCKKTTTKKTEKSKFPEKFDKLSQVRMLDF